MNLLPASIVSHEAEGTVFDLCGQRTRLSVDPAVAKIAPGTGVTVGIRPRAFLLEDASGGQGLSVRIDLIEPMGAETLVHAMAEDTDVRVVVDRTQKVKEGDQLHIEVKPGQALVFNADEKLVTT